MVTLPPSDVLSISPDRTLAITAQASIAAGCYPGATLQLQWSLVGLAPIPWDPTANITAVAAALASTTATTVTLPSNTCVPTLFRTLARPVAKACLRHVFVVPGSRLACTSSGSRRRS